MAKGELGSGHDVTRTHPTPQRCSASARHAASWQSRSPESWAEQGGAVFSPEAPSTTRTTRTTPLLPLLAWDFSPSAPPRQPSSHSYLCPPLLPHCTPASHSLLSYQRFFFFPSTAPAFSPFLVNFASCEQPDCLSKIDRLTFYPTHGCTSLAKEIFAVKTNTTLTLHCPGYSGIRVSGCDALLLFNILELTLYLSGVFVQCRSRCDFHSVSFF